MFGGLAFFLDMKGKASIYIGAVVETYTCAREKDSWSFFRTTRDVPTKSLSPFVTGQTIPRIEIRVTEFSQAEVAARSRLPRRSTNDEEFNECDVDQNKRKSLSAFRAAFGDSSVLRTPLSQDGASDDRFRVVFLPVLLFCVLRDRALR
jgi:hypothetical protein